MSQEETMAKYPLRIEKETWIAIGYMAVYGLTTRNALVRRILREYVKENMPKSLATIIEEKKALMEKKE